MRNRSLFVFSLSVALVLAANLGYLNYRVSKDEEIVETVSGCDATEIALKLSDIYMTVRCQNDFVATTHDHDEIRKFFNHSSVLRLTEVRQPKSYYCSVTRAGNITNCR